MFHRASSRDWQLLLPCSSWEVLLSIGRNNYSRVPWNNKRPAYMLVYIQCRVYLSLSISEWFVGKFMHGGFLSEELWKVAGNWGPLDVYVDTLDRCDRQPCYPVRPFFRHNSGRNLINTENPKSIRSWQVIILLMILTLSTRKILKVLSDHWTSRGQV